ncbi:MAG: sugar ABC transporter permease [Clostridia bacterium]|nr:sugar ABC transporter permease [Clostridia bacterium]
MNKTINKYSAPSVKKAKPASLDAKKARAGWWFVLPFVVGLVLIYLPILFNSIRYTFSIIKQTGTGLTLTFCGFDNYSDALFADPEFLRVLVSSIQQLLFDVPAIVIFSLFMAIVLNQKMLGRGVFRAILFIPVIISTGIIESIDSSSLQSYMTEGVDTGNAQQSSASEIVNSMDVAKLFGSMAVGTELVNYVVNIVNNIFNIVNRSGVQMLVFLAGLQSISPSIYESCTMEGASAWETFWKITFPMISPMILVNAVYTIIDSFTSESNSVMAYIKETEINHSQGVSSAMGWIYFMIVILMIAIIALFISSFVFYQRRD